LFFSEETTTLNFLKLFPSYLSHSSVNLSLLSFIEPFKSNTSSFTVGISNETVLVKILADQLVMKKIL